MWKIGGERERIIIGESPKEKNWANFRGNCGKGEKMGGGIFNGGEKGHVSEGR